MNKKLSSLLVLCPLLLVGCAKNDKPTDGGDPEPQPKPEEKITYSDIYHYEYVKSPSMTGKRLYRASDGYIDNTEQGYNNFYYQVKSDNQFSNMIYEDGAFVLNGASIKLDEMTSITGVSATRCFVAPEGGEVLISGTVHLIKGESAHLSVYINNTLLTEKDVDKDGVYHSDQTTIKKGDNIYFIIDGDVTASYNPVVDYNLTPEMSLHHAADGYYGDVHPFYDHVSKKMYMFYLSTGNQSVGDKHQTFESLLTTSSDMIHYNEEAIRMNDRSRPEQDCYYVLNVFKDKEGRYRSAEGMGNHSTTSVSDDLHLWNNGTEPYIDPADDFLKYRYAVYFDNQVVNGRDPDMCYDPETDSYYCVTLVYKTGAGAKGDKAIQLYIGNNKGEFAQNGHFLVNFNGRGDPECPQIKKIGNRWYLLYSVAGTGTKGNVGKLAYRVGDEGAAIKDVDWESKPELYLDGEDLHAAQINEVGNKYYQYGWLNYKYNTSVWGGYLNLPHEIYQDNDGVLRSKLDEELLRLLNKGLVYKDNRVYSANTDVNFKLTRNLITADIDLVNSDNAGLKITHNSDVYFIGIVNRAGKKYLTLNNEFDGYKCEVLAHLLT